MLARSRKQGISEHRSFRAIRQSSLSLQSRTVTPTVARRRHRHTHSPQGTKNAARLTRVNTFPGRRPTDDGPILCIRRELHLLPFVEDLLYNTLCSVQQIHEKSKRWSLRLKQYHVTTCAIETETKLLPKTVLGSLTTTAFYEGL